MNENVKSEKIVVTVFSAFLILSWLGLGIGFIKLFIGLAKELPPLFRGVSIRSTVADVLIEIFLKRLVFVWILIHLQSLVLSISRGAPFDPRNPRRIKRIAWAPLAWAGLDLLHSLYWAGFRPMSAYELFKLLYSGPGLYILFAVGIFIIAKVFEMAIDMKKDRDLTI